MTKLHALANLGQSIWLDYIHRSFIASGELQALIDQGLRGITSNPTIFEKAIVGSHDYDEQLETVVRAGAPAEAIYSALVLEDIRNAAGLLRPVFEQTQGADGYVSLEVSPTLAHATDATLEEALRLWSLVDRPNLMVKIPATIEGIPAIHAATAAGVNVNVTLIFSLARYAKVIEAYLAGLRQRLEAGRPIDQIASVASFFISRVDSKVDRLLDQTGGQEAQALKGQAAIANAKLAYRQFQAVFESDRFADLQAHGARLQRPLWASTSTKNPAYSDILYVQELIGRHTVNTMPQETLEAFLDHGSVRLTIHDDIDRARSVFQSLEDLGVSMEQVTQELEDEGVAAFANSFESLQKSIRAKHQHVNARIAARYTR